MAYQSPRHRDPLITDINITPLVDVVLVLLVVLMVVSTYIVSQGMRVDLPSSAQEDSATTTPLVLTVLRDGEIRLDGRAIFETSIQEEMVRAFGVEPDRPLIISAEDAVPHGRVVAFVEMARRSGGSRFAIKVEKNP